MIRIRTVARAALSLGLLLLATVAQAQSIESLYRGKSIRLVVAAAPGGGADLYARVLVKYFGRHIPGNPSFIIQNRPGGGGMTAALHTMAVAPHDGSTIAFLQRNSLLEPLLSDHKSDFDPRRLNWLGSLNKDTYVIIAWHTAPVKSLKDALTTELILGNTGGGNENVTFPELLNRVLGSKFRLVRGYPGSHELGLAIERGEVQGRALTWTTLRGDHTEWINERKVNLLVQFGLTRNPEIGDVPNALELVTNPDDRQLLELMFAPLEAGRPFALPPETPAPIVEALRKAFAELAADPDFIRDVKARGGSVELLNGLQTQQLIANVYKTPDPILARARAVLRATQP
jgi:tripartite-type tricarboxylate transporter receptor subunit TctC